jgi:hypothetical protein
MKWWCLTCGWQSDENAQLPKVCGGCGKLLLDENGQERDAVFCAGGCPCCQRTKDLIDEIKRIMTTLNNDPATLEMLQEAVDAAETE